MRSYLKWGPNFKSNARLEALRRKAAEFKVGDKVLAGGERGKVIGISVTGSITVKVGMMRRQYHPDHVQKIA